MGSEHKLDLQPIDWLPIEQMTIGTEGLLVTHDDIVVTGQLIENDLVKVYEIDTVRLKRETGCLHMHITEFKLFFSAPEIRAVH